MGARRTARSSTSISSSSPAAGCSGAAIGKYQALAYFSDAMSLQIVRNLGGGSLTDALLFSLSELGLAAIALGGAAIFYLGLLWLLRKRWRDAAPLPDHWRPSRRQWALMLVATPLILFGVNRIDDARYAGRPVQRADPDRHLAARGDRLRPGRLELVHLPDRPGAVRRRAPSLCARRAGRRDRPGRVRRRFRLRRRRRDRAAGGDPGRTAAGMSS